MKILGKDIDYMDLVIPTGVIVAWYGGLLNIQWVSPLFLVVGYLIIAVPYSRKHKNSAEAVYPSGLSKKMKDE